MAVGFRIDFLLYQIGHGDFLHSFFSTISFHLEPEGWGTKYPYLLKKLYQGKLSWKDAPKALEELNTIQKQLKHYGPDKVIWDIEDLSKQPPWKDNISSEITDLSNYFVTSDGRDLIEVLKRALRDSINEKIDLEIASL
ncbi:immunity 70 family protein [Virgibacillus pantothenticus]|uniref:immunity 70 family protein n=1 Tax=Virgibacillus pantothenticus TaxID=1473 RepID=UPI0025B17895|nr:immunity 70 family protein [Virgibacillus pantothenticus]